MVALLATPLAARAGVVVDPNGPAGKQYSAGLDRARDQASGGGGTAGVPGSTQQAPLFGEGISPEDAAGSNGGSTQNGNGGSAAAKSSAVAIEPGGSGSNTLEIAGISLAVLLAGGLVALAARGLSRRAT